MKLIDEIEKKAERLIQKENNERQVLADRVATAKAELAALINEAETLAENRDFDKYAENMENQRKQRDIINLAEHIEEDYQSPEKKAAREAKVRTLLTEEQAAFDDETKKEFAELEKVINQAAAIAQNIQNKAERLDQVKANYAACLNVFLMGTIRYPGYVYDMAEMPQEIERWKQMVK